MTSELSMSRTSPSNVGDRRSSSETAFASLDESVRICDEGCPEAGRPESGSRRQIAATVEFRCDTGLSAARMPLAMEPYRPEVADRTTTLLQRAQGGDVEAIEELMARYRPRLVRWAAGRLPAYSRGAAETQDIVQDTMLQAFRRLGEIEIRGEGTLQAYLRQCLLNGIRMQIRRAKRKPSGSSDLKEPESPEPSPIDAAIGAEAAAGYERALATLSDTDREIIVAHVEFGCSHEELARLTGKASANTARIALRRALARLAAAMARGNA